MPDVYGRASDAFGGSFAADATQVNFANLPAGIGVGLMTQSLQVGYQQNVQRVFQIGSPLIFYVAGRTQGQLVLGRTLGPSQVQTAFYSTYGNVCNAASNNLAITMNVGCQPASSGFVSNNQKLTYALKFNVLVQISMATEATSMLINETLQLMFGSMTVST